MESHFLTFKTNAGPIRTKIHKNLLRDPMICAVVPGQHQNTEQDLRAPDNRFGSTKKSGNTRQVGGNIDECVNAREKKRQRIEPHPQVEQEGGYQWNSGWPPADRKKKRTGERLIGVTVGKNVPDSYARRQPAYSDGRRNTHPQFSVGASCTCEEGSMSASLRNNDFSVDSGSSFGSTGTMDNRMIKASLRPSNSSSVAMETNRISSSKTSQALADAEFQSNRYTTEFLGRVQLSPGSDVFTRTDSSDSHSHSSSSLPPLKNLLMQERPAPTDQSLHSHQAVSTNLDLENLPVPTRLPGIAQMLVAKSTFGEIPRYSNLSEWGMLLQRCYVPPASWDDHRLSIHRMLVTPGLISSREW
eukprot:TRINITY_DN4600_c0_g1_i2.p1 TRINITY_DN4600_c0_g1~~TRINITY_DN4600_c0_g1_i2.p1  ORF type:complete len:358 (-),score=10.34 TRINITY_DN4600_c0_g1_i2:174-1247(-)